MPDNLYSAVKTFSTSKTRKVKEYSGILGLPISSKTVKVPDRNGYVYVRLRDNDSEIIQAYNGEVSPVWNLPVIVVYQGGGWKIKGRDVDRYSDWGSDSAFVPEHHFQHEFNRDVPGGDVVFVYPQQFMPILVTPSGTGGAENVLIQSYSFRKSSGWMQAGGTGTASLVFYKPLDDTATVGMVYLHRTSGNPGFLINSGSSVTASTTGTHDLLQYLPSLPSTDYEPLAMVRMVSGTEAIDWENLYDIRQFFPGMSTGTGGGGTPGGSDTQVQVNEAGAFAGYDWFHVNTTLESVIVGAGEPDLQSVGALNIIGDGLSPRVNLWSYGASNTGFVDFYSARGTKASPLPTQEGDSLGRGLRGFGRGTGSWPTNSPSVYIEGVASQTFTGTGRGAGWRVWVTPRGVTTRIQGLLVDERGLTVPEVTGTPANPDSGYGQIYPKTDGLYYHRSDGTEYGPFGAGSLPVQEFNRVMISNGTGTMTTDPHFVYLEEINVLTLGAASVPVQSPNMFNVVGSGTAPSFNAWAFSDSTRGLIAFQRARGTQDTPTAVQHNDALGRIAWRGYDGSDVNSWASTRAQLESRAVGNYDNGGGSAGSKIVMSVTPSGTTTMADMFTVNQAGADIVYGKYNISGSPHRHMSVSPIVLNSAGSGTYNVPADLVYAIVEIVAGGGGGGGVSSAAGQSSVGGAGGGGEYRKGVFTKAQLGSSVAYYVALGGSGGTAGANNGIAGSNTVFGAFMTANGGGSGDGQAASATVPRPGGGCGAGGTGGSGGSVSVAGGSGLMGLNVATNTNMASCGGGTAIGGTAYSTGGTGLDENGTNGKQYGGGGSGARISNSAVDKAGGDGATGVIIIYEFF